MQTAQNISLTQQREIADEIKILSKQQRPYEATLEILYKQSEWKLDLQNKQKIFSGSGGYDEAINNINKGKKIIETMIEEYEEELEGFKEKTQNTFREMKMAQKEITPKLVKRIYKYLKVHSDHVIVTLLESFVACLRNKERATPDDVEIYFRTHTGLMVAVDKFDPMKVSGTNAKAFKDNIETVRNEFVAGSKYVRYIPIIVWLNKACHMIKWAIEEKQIREKLEAEQDKMENYDKAIEAVNSLKEAGLSLNSGDFHKDA